MRFVGKGGNMISVKEAQKNGIPRWKLAQMASSGELVRLARGVYADEFDLKQVVEYLRQFLL